MATGFVQRFKGKIVAAAQFFGPTQVYGPGTVFAGSTASATLQTIPQANGVATINASSALSIFSLQGLPSPGAKLLLALTVSSGVFVKAAAGSAFDASTNTVFKSTYSMQVSLTGLSTVAWRVDGVWPPPSTLVGGSGITLSTTT